MDFAIFAIAFNIGNLHNKGKYMSGNGQKSAVLPPILIVVVIFHPKSEIHPRHDFFCPVNLKLTA
jgi:hypothetical protein